MSTALERHLAGEVRTVGPIEALAAARRHFLRGDRLDMQELATELGVSRATLYRWTGSRELLLGEVLWSLAEVGIREAREIAREASGAERIARFSQHMLKLTAANHGVRRLLDNEPEAGLRILSSKDGVQQRRLIKTLEALIGEEVEAGRFTPRLDVRDLAYAIVRINESFLWRDLITGEEPDLDAAGRVVRVLLGI
jgi:AcrR family transcriptional regulator